MRWLHQAARGLSYLFYPRLCCGCRRPLIQAEYVLCLHCNQLLPRTGPLRADNETSMRIAGRFPFIAAASFAYFTGEGLLQHLLHGLKYRGRKDIGLFLGQQFARMLQGSGLIQQADLIASVPLHPKKKAARGYNQSDLIAAGMSELLSTPWSGKLLRRLRATESQTRKSRTERTENVTDAFAPVYLPPPGTHILLVDDVLTTGSTIEACARTLQAAADVKISIATIGIAV